MITSVFFDTAADPGHKLDAAVQDEIDLLAPSTLDTGDVKEYHIDTDAVTTSKIKAGSVTHPKLADDAVEANNIKDGTVGTPELADNSVTGLKAGTGTVTAVDEAGNYIESEEWHGTSAQYAMIVSPDPNTTYFMTA